MHTHTRPRTPALFQYSHAHSSYSKQIKSRYKLDTFRSEFKLDWFMYVHDESHDSGTVFDPGRQKHRADEQSGSEGQTCRYDICTV